MRPSVLLLLDESHWRPWGHMLHTVRTGETAFDHAHGTGLFEYLAGHPEVAAVFNAGMLGNSPAHARLVAATYDFSRMSVVVDVGGGRGRLLATILERYPRLRGILFDQPHVIEDARQILEEVGVVDRCELVGGSFFDAVPAGGDAYVLRNIIHDWEDDQAVAILTSCRRAMTDGARLVLVERYLATIPTRRCRSHADLEMLVNVGGRERTTDEYAALLARSGLRLTRTIALDRARGDGASAHRGAARLNWSAMELDRNRCRAPGFSCSTTSAAPGGDDRRHRYRSRHDQAGLCTASKALASAIPPRAAPVNAEL